MRAVHASEDGGRKEFDRNGRGGGRVKCDALSWNKVILSCKLQEVRCKLDTCNLFGTSIDPIFDDPPGAHGRAASDASEHHPAGDRSIRPPKAQSRSRHPRRRLHTTQNARHRENSMRTLSSVVSRVMYAA
ncbi:hypothetical protein Trydic_g12851 [Trypoxylus dichotomus]